MSVRGSTRPREYFASVRSRSSPGSCTGRWGPTWCASSGCFFSHHFIVDLRPLLIAGIVALYWPTVLEARVFRARLRLPILASFLGVAVFIWIAEQVGTGTATWIYPSQADGWHPVSAAKVGSWFLLMVISVVLVTWVYPPEPPDTEAPPDAPDPD